MEERLREQVIKALEDKLSYPVVLSHEEWEEAKRDALNDIYLDKLCFMGEVTNEHFINVIVSILYCARCIPA